MTKPLARLLLAIGTTWSLSALAEERRAVLAIEHMTCPACPYIVEQSLRDLDGVIDVIVSFDDKTAIVRYDDVQVSPQDLVAAPTRAGYPAALQP